MTIILYALETRKDILTSLQYLGIYLQAIFGKKDENMSKFDKFLVKQKDFEFKMTFFFEIGCLMI